MRKTPPRLLTKSKFKIGCECPTKLYFTGKPQYGNNLLNHSFLESLAEGGFQVGELAKLYYEGGIEIDTLDTESAVLQTRELLKNNSVTLYEAAIQYKDLLVRVDILRKHQRVIELIEVKAKGIDPLEKGNFSLSAKWKPYLIDIAFQSYVIQKALPDFQIVHTLLLANKIQEASIDGLNQMFVLEKTNHGSTHVRLRPEANPQDLGIPILIPIDVNAEVEILLQKGINEKSFPEQVNELANAYLSDQPAFPKIGPQCKNCEFRISAEEKKQNLKSGFDECWKKAAQLKDSDLEKPMIFDVWNLKKSHHLINTGRYFMSDLKKEDIAPTPDPSKPGLSQSERQWLQISKVLQNDIQPYLDREGLFKEISKWKYPLHFIDFETTTVAIPFHRGRRPYEIIAFQFSHHVMAEDGTIAHHSEFIHTKRGIFPNFEFIRALKCVLSQDEGTIFRYAAHENTVLCQIHEQLLRSKEPDRDELMIWIESVTHSPRGNEKSWKGNREMIDLCDLVKRYSFFPETLGSNSIKKVLPAILNASPDLKSRYSQPIYGTDDKIKSKNFKNWSWIQYHSNGSIKDPYALLEPVFSDLSIEQLNAIVPLADEGLRIADGGAAMMAYARLQFTEMSHEEHQRITQALLRYCELDTFAMTLLVEYWKQELNIL